MGFTSIPSSLLPQPSGTNDLENRVDPSQKLQQLNQPPPQAPPQQPQADPYAPAEQYYTQKFQQNQQVPPSGGPVRRLLQNFFSGMGTGMMHQAGVPTPEMEQQDAIKGLETINAARANVSNIQAQVDLHRQVLQNTMRQPVPPELAAYLPGVQYATPSEMVAAVSKQRLAQLGNEGKLDVQDLKNAGQNENKMMATPEMLVKYDLPEEALGKPVKLSDLFQSQRLHMQGESTQWLPDGAGGFMMVTNTRSRQFGTPSATPNAPAATPTATPSSPNVAPNPIPARPTVPSKGPRTITGNQVGRAFDPSTNEWRQVTASQAQAQGLQQWQKMEAAETDKIMYSQRQFNDVQTNTSRYTQAAIDATKKPPSTTDYVNLHALMNKAGPFDFKVKIGQGGEISLPGLSALLEGLSRESTSEAYKALGPEAKALYDGYVRTLSAVPAYIKGLTNVGRFNETQLEMELRNIAPPSYAPEDIVRKQQQWQENIDRGVEGMTRIPGLDTTNDIRNRYERGTPKSESAGLGNSGNELRPPSAAGTGMKWQHRTNNGQVEWRQVPSGR